MSHRSVFTIVTVAVSCLMGCASGPVVPVPPTVRVTELDSLLITPEIVKFQAKLVIDNQMNGGLNIQEVSYGADVRETPVFTEKFTQLHPMKAHGQQTVTFPFQIAMKDILPQAVDVLNEEALRMSFRGEVLPVGFDPVPFRVSKSIPLPKLPLVAIEGARGNPWDRVFTVFLRMKNTNNFPMSLQSMDSYLELNGTRYGLLRTQEPLQLAPGAAGRITLTMQQSNAKTLSMALNLAQSRAAVFTVGGSVTCRTPIGCVYLPFQLTSEPTKS